MKRSPQAHEVPSGDIRVTRVGDYIFLSWDPKTASLVSEAETATLALVLQGKSNREIALERGVAERTVANQLASAFRKLGVSSRYELQYRAKASVR